MSCHGRIWEKPCPAREGFGIGLCPTMKEFGNSLCPAMIGLRKVFCHALHELDEDDVNITNI